jgi:hypothetical protein
VDRRSIVSTLAVVVAGCAVLSGVVGVIAAAGASDGARVVSVTQAATLLLAAGAVACHQLLHRADFRRLNARLSRLHRSIETLEATCHADSTGVEQEPRAHHDSELLAAISALVSERRSILPEIRSQFGRLGSSALSTVGRDNQTPSGATAEVSPARLLDIDELPESIWNEPHGRPPSYVYKLHESKRRRHMMALLGHRQRVWAFNDKLAGYQLATSLGVSVPEVYHRSTNLEDLDWDGLPDRFVIKAHNGTNNRGVFLLVRQGPDQYRDLMQAGPRTRSQVMAEYRAFIDDGKVSETFAVEELLAPRADLIETTDIPDDLKIYCFYDQPFAIMQRRTFGDPNRRNWKFRFWTEAWVDLGPVKYPERIDPDLQPPAGGDAVLDAASVIGRHLALPFVRLDLYDTDRGPVFGEVSPHPGPPEKWEPAADEMLGRAWEIAEARLLADRILPTERLRSDAEPSGPVPDPQPLPER